MADRRVNVHLSANVRDYSRSVNKAADDTDKLRQKAERFDGKTYRAKVEVDGAAKANAEIASLQQRLRQLEGRYTARFNMDARGAQRDVALIMNSISALGPAAVTAAATASGALLALGSTVGVLASGLGVAVMGFAGLGDALEAMGDAERAAGENAAAAAQQRTAATRSIEDARRSVVRAEQEVGRAREDAAWASAQAAARVEDATEDEAVAHQRLRYALEDLHAARQQAIRDMEDMRERSSDLALDEREANLRLAEARDELTAAEADSTTSARDLEKARIDVLRAEDRLTDVQRDRARQATDLNAAEKAGLEGLPAVVSARRNVEDAERGVASARQALAEAQAEAARTERQSAQQIAAAVQGVEDAQRNLSEAMVDANVKLGEQSTEAKKLAEEMGKLGPAGQDFAKFLYSLKPQMKELKALAEGGMFPGMEAGIRDLMVLFPDVAYLVDKTSKALGDLAAEGGDALNDPFWQGYIRFLADQAAPTLLSFGRIIGDLAKGLAGMQMAFNPLAKDVVGGLEDMAEKFAHWGTTLESNQGFQKFIQYVRENGPTMLATLGSLVSMIGDLAQAAAPLGPVVLTVIKALADGLGFIASIPGVGTTLVAVAAAMGTLNLALRAMEVAKFSRLGQFLSSFPAHASNAALGAGVLTERLTGSANAGEKVASAGDKVGRSLSAMGRALPVAGVALIGLGILYEEFGSKADEAAGKVIDGSMTMEQAMQSEIAQLERSTLWWNSASEQQQQHAAVRAEVTEEFRKQYAAMGPLQQRQTDVRMAQELLNSRVSEFGAQSPQARDALNALRSHSRELEIQQIMTAHGVDRATAAMLRQRDAAMEATNADIAYDRAALGVEQASIRAADATRDYGAGSLEARDANLSLRESTIRSAQAAYDKALADAEATGKSNGAELAAKAQKDEYLRLADMVKEPLRSELLHLAGQLNTIPDGDFKVTGTGEAKWGAPGGPLYTISPDGPVSSRIGGLATGGLVSSVLPGYTPGRDVHTFVSPTGGALRLSGGEGILRPEATRVLGKSGIDGINYAARTGGESGVARYLAGGSQAFRDGGIFQNGVKPFPKIASDLHASISTNLARAMKPKIVDQVKLAESGGHALDWAIGEAGKPYIWAGVGPMGYDCSGFMSAIMNVMQGLPPHRRRGSTGTFPWPGMLPGVGPGLSVGSTRNAGNGVGHMAGTIGGVNVESRSGDGVVVGPRARGATDRLFNMVYHMPPSGNFGATSVSNEGVRAAVQAVAARYGWGGGIEWASLDRLITKESGWNPNARNPRSSAAGLFQKMQSIHGPVEGTPAGQAEWGLGYIRGRYGSPSSALAFHNRNNYYDEGGLARGKGYLPKYTVAPERVLSPRQTAAFEQLVDVLSRPRPVAMGPGGGSTVINKHYHLTVQNAGNSTTDLQAQFSRLEAMAGV